MKHNGSGLGHKKWFTFVIEFKVHRNIVEDGGEMNNDQAHDMLSSRFPFAYNTELKARLIEKPTRKAIRKAQGYTR